MNAGRVSIDVGHSRAGLMPVGKERVGRVRVLVTEPEAGGDVWGSEIINVGAAGAEGAADGELGAGKEDSEPCEERSGFELRRQDGSLRGIELLCVQSTVSALRSRT
jgi:hypothetical protein